MQSNTYVATLKADPFLIEGLGEYLAAKGRSARWLGITVAGDPRLLPNLKRGQAYPAAILLALAQRLLAFYNEGLAKEEAAARLAA